MFIKCIYLSLFSRLSHGVGHFFCIWLYVLTVVIANLVSH